MNNLLIQLSVALEMILVNLLTLNLCCTKRFAGWKVFLTLLLFTAFVMAGGAWLISNGYGGNGNGSLIILGFFYLLPLCILYRDSLDRLLITACSSWIHTMFFFSIAVHISKIIGGPGFYQNALLLQTILYLCTTPLVIHFVKNRFLYVLRNIPPSHLKYLRLSSVSWFLTAILLNYTLFNNDQPLFKVFTICFVCFNVVLSYKFIVMIVNYSHSSEYFEKMAFTDLLTQQKNRLSLFQDAKSLMEKKTSFTLVYMDLDQFKVINDLYGHTDGDSYLKDFSKTVQSILAREDSLYRMSGDEFICLLQKTPPRQFLQLLKQKTQKGTYGGHKFLGVSCGSAVFPADGNNIDELIAAADQKMYVEKRLNKNLPAKKH